MSVRMSHYSSYSLAPNRYSVCHYLFCAASHSHHLAPYYSSNDVSLLQAFNIVI